ncbi:MAG: alanine--tRNA ligase, partial [Anaerolineae bacterium]|nr:alanine--tRNA ligase [Phycisphaerae bacterium]
SRRHGTFFEMLGNWSFGDYFKRGAIEMAWELMTGVWKMDKSRLHVTCYEGDEANGVPRDTEAANLWKEIAGLPDDHIHFLGKSNFWEMGDTGPCGPSSEIFFDRTPNANGGPSVVKDDDPRVMEFWNLVFIQYNRNADQSLTPLPAQHVDTGMGFERICSIMQDKEDMYGIDLFDPFFAAITGMTGFKYTGKFPPGNAPDPVAEAASPELRRDIAFRVIADHIRMATFAITDGALPGNKGRDSVVRSVIRRAVRFGYQQFNLKQPFMWQLVSVVADAMGDAFPELRTRQNHVAQTIQVEEQSFFRTLERGIRLFEEAAARVRESGQLPAEDVFHLHTTFGFPPDMTRQMALERGLRLDMEGYEAIFAQFKKDSGAQRNRATQSVSDMKGLPATIDSDKFDHDQVTARILAFGEGAPFTIVTTAGGHLDVSEEAVLVLNRTCFYGEQGGQAGDTGEVRTPNGVFRVDHTSRAGDYVFHEGVVTEGSVAVGEEATLTVSGDRHRTKQNHTATHLSNWALRQVLGDAVQQKGSLVDPDKLRFDFSHGKPMSDEEIARVEQLVNERIAKPQAVYAEVAPQEQALKISGLRAVFGEKYPPMVRVVSIGVSVKDLLSDPTNVKWREYSIEFCGGTHLRSSDEAKCFVVTAEEAISKGIRRLVALTGEHGEVASAAGSSLDQLVDRANKTPDAELPGAISSIQKSLEGDRIPLRAKRRAQSAISPLQAKHKAWQKSNQSSGAKIDVAAVASDLLSKANGSILVADVQDATEDNLRAIIDSLKKRSPSIAVLLATVVGEKVAFVSAVSDDLIAKGLKAGDWIRATAKVAGGGGGGSPQMAQAGGKDPSKLAEALATARDVAAAALR